MDFVLILDTLGDLPELVVGHLPLCQTRRVDGSDHLCSKAVSDWGTSLPGHGVSGL